MGKLRKRAYRADAKFRRENAAAKGFLAAQRDRVKRPMPARAGKGGRR